MNYSLWINYSGSDTFRNRILPLLVVLAAVITKTESPILTALMLDNYNACNIQSREISIGMQVSCWIQVWCSFMSINPMFSTPVGIVGRLS